MEVGCAAWGTPSQCPAGNRRNGPWGGAPAGCPTPAPTKYPLAQAPVAPPAEGVPARPPHGQGGGLRLGGAWRLPEMRGSVRGMRKGLVAAVAAVGLGQGEAEGDLGISTLVHRGRCKAPKRGRQRQRRRGRWGWPGGTPREPVGAPVATSPATRGPSLPPRPSLPSPPSPARGAPGERLPPHTFSLSPRRRTHPIWPPAPPVGQAPLTPLRLRLLPPRRVRRRATGWGGGWGGRRPQRRPGPCGRPRRRRGGTSATMGVRRR